jgi:hypothetical protein
VILTLTEKDWLFNDGNSIILPCRPNSSQTVDIQIPGGHVQQALTKVKDILDDVKLLLKVAKFVDPIPSHQAYIGTANTIVNSVQMGAKAFSKDEKSVLHNLHFEVLTGS